LRKPEENALINIPNALTLLRLMLVPLVIVAITRDWTMAALIMFVVAGITDGVDGYVAKRFDMRTEIGAYLDPLADKALIVSIFITLAIVNVIPVWLTILVVSRDVMIIGAVIVSWLVDKPVDIDPLRISKANTAGQIIFAGLALSSMALGMPTADQLDVLSIAVMLLTVSSIAAYCLVWLKHIAG
jgi:cardiolipin synthase (CMP-forming)